MARKPGPQSDQKFDSHYAAIGRVTETWAHLEFAIDQEIWRLAHTEQAFGACITSQLIGVNKRMDAYRALFNAHDGSSSLRKKLASFAGRLNSLQEERHRVVHDPRAINYRTGQMSRIQVTAKTKLIMDWQPESADSLMKTRERIAEKVDEFIALHDEVASELSASRKKSPLIIPQIRFHPLGDEAPATDTE